MKSRESVLLAARWSCYFFFYRRYLRVKLHLCGECLVVSGDCIKRVESGLWVLDGNKNIFFTIVDAD